MDVANDLLMRGLARGSTVRLQLSGACMEPLLRDGDWAQVEPVAEPLHTGDLVLARLGGDRLVCHRVLGKTGTSLLLAGDRSSYALEHRTDEIVGRLAAIERDGSAEPFRRRWLDVLVARLHLLSHTLRNPIARRVVERVRRRLLHGFTTGPVARACKASIA